jgi:hypothetical protein
MIIIIIVIMILIDILMPVKQNSFAHLRVLLVLTDPQSMVATCCSNCMISFVEITIEDN